MMKRILWSAGLLVLVLGIGVGLYHSRPDISLKEESLSAAKSGGEYLLGILNDEGRFYYLVNALNGRSLGGYNILRHAGTTYSLLELYEETGEKDILNAAESALSYLDSKTEKCFGFSEDFQCVLDGRKVKLGGNALAVLAYAKHAEITGQDDHINEAEDLARWIVETQSDEGEFLRHIEFIDTGELDDHISDYYPGEAIFALARLYKETGNEEWLLSGQKAADWLINVRDKGKTQEDLLPDHWLLYGLEELYEIEPNELYLSHARKIASSITANQNKGYKGAEELWNGGYGENPNTTPAATRTEGLIAAYRMFKDAGLPSAETQETYDAIELGIRFLLSAQITSAKANALGLRPGSVGGFPENLTSNEIRIDFVQHAISALLGYAGLAK